MTTLTTTRLFRRICLGPAKGLCPALLIRALVLAAWLTVPVGPSLAAPPEPFHGQGGPPLTAPRTYQPDPGLRAQQRYGPRPSLDEQTELQRRWQSMPREQKEEYRRRMEKFKRLQPQDRELYRRRYQQYQKLPPQDRRRIRQQLEKWERLSPQERDRIREKFLNRRGPQPRQGGPYYSG